MMFSIDSSTGPARSAAAAGTTRMDRRRLLCGGKTGGGKGAKGGKPESARETGLAGDVAKWRKAAESGGKSFLRPSSGTKVFSAARDRAAAPTGWRSAYRLRELRELRKSAAPGRRPRCLTGVGAAPILPHRKNGLKSRKYKAF